MWIDALSELVSIKPSGSRAGLAREMIGYSGSLIDGERTFLCNQRRALDPAYAAAEVIWYLSRSANGKMICAYAPQYARFLDEDGEAYGAYGRRIRHNASSDQLALAVNMLNADASSRQCVVSLWHPMDLYQGAFGAAGFGERPKDMPCTLTWQFLLRQNKLHMVVNMRSNDAWLGMPYDIFAFTCFQRLVAGQLGCEVGEYIHNVGSMHLYEKNYNAAMEALEEHRVSAGLVFPAHYWKRVDRFNAVKAVVSAEKRIREGVAPTQECVDQAGDMLRDLLRACCGKWNVETSFPYVSTALSLGEKNHADHRRDRRPG